MGLSSQQASSNGLDWNKNLLQAQNSEHPKQPSMKRQPCQQQNSEPLKCPRCDSTNTKFCYYNNYNESQPRHYCRACKRHWTAGGTLRNVPVGGGRKNKRLKKTIPSPTVPSATATNSNTRTITINPTSSSMDSKLIRASQQIQNLSPGGQRRLAGFLYQPLVHQASLLPQYDSTNTCELDYKFSDGTEHSLFMGASATALPQQPQSNCLQFPFSSSSSYCDTNLSSITASLHSSNVYNHGDEFKTIDEPTITSTFFPSTYSNHAQPWQVGMDMPSSWNWDDIGSLVSTDLNTSWTDTTDVKP